MNKRTKQSKPRETMAVTSFKAVQHLASLAANRVYNGLQEHKLTPSQFGVLESLYKQGSMYQCDLAREINKTTGNITMVIDNLEKRKLVKRVREKDDRRYFQVVLTAEGEQTIKKLYRGHVKKVKMVMGGFTEAEQQEILRLCTKLAEQ